jgi:hypothetical protein
VSSTTTPEPAVEPAAPAEEKAKASAAKPAAPKVEEGVTVDALVAAVRELAIKPKLRWNPKRTYASLLVGGKNVAYVSKPNRKGMKVEPAIAHGDLRNGAKKLFREQVGKGAFGAVAMLVSVKELPVAAKAIQAANDQRLARQVGAKEQA